MRIKKGLIAAFFLFFYMATSVFAKDFQINGSIKDEHGKPISKSSIIFLTPQKNPIKTVLSDSQGNYSTLIPEGTYTITIKGPENSTIPHLTLENQIITFASTRNFVLSSTKPPPQQSSPLSNTFPLIPFVFGSLGILTLIVLLFLFSRKIHKKTTVPLPNPNT